MFAEAGFPAYRETEICRMSTSRGTKTQGQSLRPTCVVLVRHTGFDFQGGSQSCVMMVVDFVNKDVSDRSPSHF
jgi:hypothetical protein